MKKCRNSAAQETLRRSFQPDHVKLLFVGESPPASGRFFYQADSGLYRAFRDTFAVLDSSINDANFLSRFQEYGCYLVDLCADPVDNLQPKARRTACAMAEDALAQTIDALKPLTIAILLRSIEANVNRAIAKTNWSGSLIALPYPGRWARLRTEFATLLTPVIRELSRTD